MKIPSFLPLIFACIMLVSSCDKESGQYSVGELMVSFGVVEKPTESADNNYIIHLDNGDQLISTVMPPKWIELNNGQRVKVSFIPSVEKPGANNNRIYFGKINDLRIILFNNILSLTPANNDSLGHDPVAVRESWITGDSILTISFNYFTEGSVHRINLVKNTEGNGKDQPFVFEFRHNARGDHQNYRSPGIASFNLNPFKIKGQHTTDFILRYTEYDGKVRDLPFMINY
jgi:hypothetical protein